MVIRLMTTTMTIRTIIIITTTTSREGVARVAGMPTSTSPFG